jgi:anti-sigma-K factor RskA
MTGPNEHDDDQVDDQTTTPEPGWVESMHDLTAAYALHALVEREHADMERALEQSPELRDEADGFAETVARLAELEEPADPPPALKARLMGQLGDAPQLPMNADSPVSVPESAASLRDEGRAASVARRRWFQRPGAIAAAAAAVIVLVVGAVLGIGWPGTTGWGAQVERAAITTAPDAETTTVDANGAEVTLVSSAERGRSVLIAEGLPEPGDDQTFQLWYIDDAGAVSAGTFDVGAEESWRVLEGEFTPGDVVGMTIEPVGGSPQPTTEPIVVIPT